MANHNYVKDEYFNILTARREKGKLIFTGEAKKGIAEGDIINYFFNDQGDFSVVDKLTERRDAKAYPEGNNYYYEAVCSGIKLTDDIKQHYGIKK